MNIWSSRFSSISAVAEGQHKKERRKNRLQLLTDERDNLTNAAKEKEKEDKLSDGEGEYASATEFSLAGKIKKIKTGPKFQADIPLLCLNQSDSVNNVNKRKFKSMWNPVTQDEDKAKAFLSGVRELLNVETCNEDFLLRLLSKNGMDANKTLNIIKANQEYFTKMFKITTA